jgi:hypothetical protein
MRRPFAVSHLGRDDRRLFSLSSIEGLAIVLVKFHYKIRMLFWINLDKNDSGGIILPIICCRL